MKYSETIVSKRLRTLKICEYVYHASFNRMGWLYKITL